MPRTTHCPPHPLMRRAFALVIGAACVLGAADSHAAGSDLYYEIGGAAPVSISAGRGYAPTDIGLGIEWGIGSICGGLNPFLTVKNQLNGITEGFQRMMGSIIESATAAVASLPALIIQHAAPGLYDLLSNGVLQARLDFKKAKHSCEAMVHRMSNAMSASGWFQQAKTQNWRRTASNMGDAVAAQRTVESEGGNEGVIWVGGDRYGGAGQPPIRVVRDTAVAGYNILHGRTNPTNTAPIPGGGGGWGSVPTATGAWAGAGAGGGGATGCSGGMCTVWGSPAEAADWITDVVGKRVIRTCSGCEKLQTKAGVGLIRKLEQEQQQIQTRLAAMVHGSMPITPENLRSVSAGPTMAITPDVIEALRKDPKAALLIHRLASEMALARTLTKAIWARRVLLAGASEPGIASNESGQKVINDKLEQLDRSIDALRSEMQIREAMADNTASVILARQRARTAAARTSGTRPPNRFIDSRERIE